jgi:hypothetical protein
MSRTELNSLGEQGWELVAVIEVVIREKTDHTFFFKRPKS